MSLKQAFKASMIKFSQPDNCLWFHQKLTIFVQVHQIKICGTICQIFPPEISKLSCHCRGAGAVLQPPDTFLSELPAASTVGICPLLFLGKFIFENKKSRKTIKRIRCLCLTLWQQYLQYSLCESSWRSSSFKEKSQVTKSNIIYHSLPPCDSAESIFTS